MLAISSSILRISSSVSLFESVISLRIARSLFIFTSILSYMLFIAASNSSISVPYSSITFYFPYVNFSYFALQLWKDVKSLHFLNIDQFIEALSLNDGFRGLFHPLSHLISFIFGQSLRMG